MKLTKQSMIEFLLMSLGAALVSMGVYFFKFPNHFSTGGVSGLSVLLGHLIPASFLSTSTINSIITILYLILGFLMLDKSFGFKTVYCSLFYTVLIQIFSWLLPMARPLTDQKLLELLFGVGLPAMGSAILFNIGASTGGSDILALILKKYSGLDVGRALLLCDVFIAGSSLFVFGIETGLFSLLGLAIHSTLIDGVIESLNRRKSFTVVTHTPDPICHYINEALGRGATVWKAQGAYTHQEQYVILTALSRHQAVLLRNFLRQNDPHAFMLITNSREIFGKGFLRA